MSYKTAKLCNQEDELDIDDLVDSVINNNNDVNLEMWEAKYKLSSLLPIMHIGKEVRHKLPPSSAPYMNK